MDSLKAGIVINNMLTGDVELNKLVQNKVFPVVSETNTTYPFIVYRRVSITPIPIKFGNAGEEILLELLVISDEYKESIELALKVRDVLDNKEIEEFEIRLVDANEQYGEGDAYIQTLIFKMTK